MRWLGHHSDAGVDERLRALAEAPVPLTRAPRAARAAVQRPRRARHVRRARPRRRASAATTPAGFMRALGTRAVDRRAAHRARRDRRRAVGHVGRAGALRRRRPRACSQDVAHRAALAVDNARLFRAREDAAELRRDLVAVVAHDLKNPLNAITMASTLLVKSGRRRRRRRPRAPADRDHRARRASA